MLTELIKTEFHIIPVRSNKDLTRLNTIHKHKCNLNGLEQKKIHFIILVKKKEEKNTLRSE